MHGAYLEPIQNNAKLINNMNYLHKKGFRERITVQAWHDEVWSSFVFLAMSITHGLFVDILSKIRDAWTSKLLLINFGTC